MNHTGQAPVIVRVTRRFEASATQVFDAFLDPDKAGRFMFATPTGRMVRVEIDPQVGGKFAFVDRRDGDDIEHVGEYLEIDRPRRLAFRFAVKRYSEDATCVTIDITPQEPGCELTLTHTLHPDWTAYKDQTEKGWIGILDGLAATLD